MDETFYYKVAVIVILVDPVPKCTHVHDTHKFWPCKLKRRSHVVTRSVCSHNLLCEVHVKAEGDRL